MTQKRYLVLQNGRVFEGKAFGADGETVAQVVFHTGEVGYAETLTSPAYLGQALVQTFPLIGNYGYVTEDMEGSRIHASALIVREWCSEPSNYRCEGDLDSLLRAQGVPGLCGVDTRALTRLLREEGTMNGMICDDPSHADLAALAAWKPEKGIEAVSVQNETLTSAKTARHTVALLDCGCTAGIRKQLLSRGCSVYDLPYNTPAERVYALGVEGVVVSDGPGDPAACTAVIDTVRTLLADGRLPVFGIALGHQIMALAAGLRTGKLPYGHRGDNQPVREASSGRIYITGQNHGYTVLPDSVPADFNIPYTNQNDNAVEGLFYPGGKAFSVEFYPGGCGDPQDTTFLYDRFTALL